MVRASLPFVAPRRVPWLGALAALLVVAVGAARPLLVPGESARAAEPCATIPYGPGDPIGPGMPDIAGHVIGTGSNEPIAGATVRLYVCIDGAPMLVASTSTDGSGAYAFDDLDGPAWYYVLAVLTGPLDGRWPAAGSSNPSAVIEVGPGASAVDLVFD